MPWFLVFGPSNVEKCETRNVNLEISNNRTAKNSTYKDSSLANEHFSHLG